MTTSVPRPAGEPRWCILIGRDTVTAAGRSRTHPRASYCYLRCYLTAWDLHQAIDNTGFYVIAPLSWDQGKEMHAHKRFTVATNVQVYFCDPRTNGLLRQYFPRGTDFSRISQSYLNAIALRLNQRPRKTLGFQTPANRLQTVLH